MPSIARSFHIGCLLSKNVNMRDIDPIYCISEYLPRTSWTPVKQALIRHYRPTYLWGLLLRLDAHGSCC